MKVDRILEIIIYLINHDNVPSSYLAERFHVSVRTIQRDMVSISSIGIPVYIKVLEPIEIKEKVMQEIERMKHLYTD